MNKKTIKQIIFISISIATNKLTAQKTVLAGGGNSGNNINGSVSFSIGQMDYINFSNTNTAISLGVQQPREYFTVGTNSLNQTTLSLNLFPNPTSNNCNLNIESPDSKQFEYHLYDASGKLLFSEIVKNGENIIPLENLASAIYFINIIENTATIQTFKVIKN